MIRRNRVAALVGAALAVLLVACTPEIPEVSPDPEETEVQPVLDVPRLERVLDDIEEHINAADEESDGDILAERMEDPALAVRTAEYRLRSATADTDDETGLQPLTTSSAVSIVAATEEWPRAVFVITEIPDEANSPLLIGLRQETPQEPYRMFSWVRLLPGVTTPQTDVAEVGSTPVDPADDSFLTSPQQALENYADLLTEGEDSEFADDFAEEPFRELVEQEAETLSENVEAAGEFTHDTAVREDDTVAMLTADGGVVVIGAMRTRHTFTKTEDDGEVEVGGQLAALSEDDGEVNESLRGTYHVMVALYVPTEQEDAQITVLGVERVLAAVSEE